MEERLSPREYQRVPGRTPKHSVRQRPTYSGVEYSLNADAVVSSAAPELAQLFDQLELRARQLALSGGEEETLTLLLEPVGPAPAKVVDLWAESVPPLYVHRMPSAQWRAAFCFQGANVRELLMPWVGYARIAVTGADGGAQAYLVRSTLVPSRDAEPQTVERALVEHAARVKAERDERRAKSAAPVDLKPLLVFERDAVTGEGRFISTGLPASESLRHLAAELRVKGGR